MWSVIVTLVFAVPSALTPPLAKKRTVFFHCAVADQDCHRKKEKRWGKRKVRGGSSSSGRRAYSILDPIPEEWRRRFTGHLRRTERKKLSSEDYTVDCGRDKKCANPRRAFEALPSYFFRALMIVRNGMKRREGRVFLHRG